MHATERLSPATTRRECARISRANNRLVTVAAAKQKQFNWSIYMYIYIMGNYASIHLWRWFWNRNEKKRKPQAVSLSSIALVALGTRCNWLVFFFFWKTIHCGFPRFYDFYAKSIKRKYDFFPRNFKLGCDQINIDGNAHSMKYYNCTSTRNYFLVFHFTPRSLRRWRRTDGRERKYGARHRSQWIPSSNPIRKISS